MKLDAQEIILARELARVKAVKEAAQSYRHLKAGVNDELDTAVQYSNSIARNLYEAFTDELEPSNRNRYFFAYDEGLFSDFDPDVNPKDILNHIKNPQARALLSTVIEQMRNLRYDDHQGACVDDTGKSIGKKRSLERLHSVLGAITAPEHSEFMATVASDEPPFLGGGYSIQKISQERSYRSIRLSPLDPIHNLASGRFGAHSRNALGSPRDNGLPLG